MYLVLKRKRRSRSEIVALILCMSDIDCIVDIQLLFVCCLRLPKFFGYNKMLFLSLFLSFYHICIVQEKYGWSLEKDLDYFYTFSDKMAAILNSQPILRLPTTTTYKRNKVVNTARSVHHTNFVTRQFFSSVSTKAMHQVLNGKLSFFFRLNKRYRSAISQTFIASLLLTVSVL